MAKKTRFQGFQFVDALPASLRVVPTSGTVDLTERRREILATAVDHQINLWNDPNYTIEKVKYSKNEDTGETDSQKVNEPPRSWIKLDGETVYLSPRYGNRPLEIQAGAPIVKLTTDEVVPFLETLKEAAKSGELDTQIRDLLAKAEKNKAERKTTEASEAAEAA